MLCCRELREGGSLPGVLPEGRLQRGDRRGGGYGRGIGQGEWF